MMVVRIVQDPSDAMIHGLDACCCRIKSLGHRTIKSPEISVALTNPGMQIHPVYKFPPAQNLPHQSLRARQRDFLLFAGFQAGRQHLFRTEQSVVQQR